MKNFYGVGDNVTVTESILVHPVQTDGLANGGDQAVVGSLHGVVNVDALASTDKVVLSTKGIYNLPVVGKDSSGSAGADANVAVAIGDKLYIDGTTAAEISKRAGQTPFGIALGTVGSGATATIPVKLDF